MRSRTIKYAPFCERGFFAHFIQILMSAVLTVERVAVEILRLSADGALGSPGENLRFSAEVDRRIALSEPLSWCSRTSVYAPLPDSGSFVHFIQILMSADLRLYGDALEHDVSLSKTVLRAAKPNFHRGCSVPALESRGANLRPRKLDEKLSRNVARARRVALLAPRATFSAYCSPLDYLYARFKLYQKGRKAYPAF